MTKTLFAPQKSTLLFGAAPLALLVAMTATPAFAQAATDQATTPATAASAPQTGSADAASTGQDIVVTGTIFRRTNTETPSPVTVLTADSLQKAGINNVADAVRSISADSSGSIPTAFTNGFGAGSAAVSLRGLTVNSTLTLIDGLRTANYPLADDGQRAFVDLNTIPNAIVDRVEVLKDGASSSYGADAIAGVVNIIMKKEIIGVEGTVEGGVTQRGDGGNQRATLTLGTGSLKEKGYNFYVSAEYQHDDAIFNRDRGFPYNTADLSSIGGDNNNAGSVVPGATTSALVAPSSQTTPGNILSGTGLVTGPYRVLNPAGCSAGQTAVTGSLGSGCQQNLVSDYGQIQPSQTRFGVTAHGTVQINDRTQAYLMASYYQNDVLASGGPPSIRSSNPISTLNIVLPVFLANGQLNPNNPYAAQGQPASIRYLFGDIAGSSEYKNHVMRGAAGITGGFGEGWHYSVDLTAAHSWLDITQNGYLNLAALTNAINTASYNFVDPTQNTAAVRSALSPAVRNQATSDLDMIQAVITKDVFQLPGGPLQLGIGGSVRYEAVNDPNGNPNETTINLNQYSAVGNRTVESAYFEINAPILDKLEINGSGRFDHYQEGYNRFSPKIGVKFTPIRQLAIRGTFSKGFRAPSFAELSGSVVGFTSSRLPCTAAAQGAHGATITQGSTGSNVCTGGSAYNQAYSIGFNTVGNPNIKPELSTSFTGGVVLQPTRWLSFTADYYNIKKTQVISGGPLSNDALNAYYSGTALPAGYTITQDSVDPAFPNAINRALFVNSPYANAGGLKTSGIDGSALIQLKPLDNVHFSSRAEVTYILHYKFQQSDGAPYVDFVGTQAPYITSSGAGTPQWRGNWQNSLDVDRYTLTATAYYTSGYKAVAYDQFGSTDCTDGGTYQGSDGNFNCHVRRFIDVDLTGSVKVNDKFNLYFNVINLTDAKAPLNAGNYAATNYNPTYTQIGAVGRTFRIGANFKY